MPGAAAVPWQFALVVCRKQEWNTWIEQKKWGFCSPKLDVDQIKWSYKQTNRVPFPCRLVERAEFSAKSHLPFGQIISSLIHRSTCLLQQILMKRRRGKKRKRRKQREIAKLTATATYGLDYCNLVEKGKEMEEEEAEERSTGMQYHIYTGACVSDGRRRPSGGRGRGRRGCGRVRGGSA